MSEQDAPWWTVPVVGWSDAGNGPQERGRTTRHALLLEAAQAFDLRGYHAASLSDILAAAGRTKGALYFHFRSKQAVAEALIDEVLGSWQLTRAAIATRGLDPLRTLLVETDAYVSRLSHDVVVRGGGRVMADGAPFAESRHAWFSDWERSTASHLLEAREAGLLRPEVDPERAARLVAAASEGHHSFAETMPGPPDYFARMNDTWLGFLPVLAVGPWIDGLRSSGWAQRPPPDPDGYRRARTP